MPAQTTLGIALGWNYADSVYSITQGIRQILDEEDYRQTQNKIKGIVNIISGIEMFVFSYNPALTAALGLAGGAALASPAFALAMLCDLITATIDFYNAQKEVEFQGWLEERIKEINYLEKRIETLREKIMRPSSNEKTDFLNDSTSLKKYYRYRKAVQEAVRPILQEWGEERPSVEGLTRRPRPLEREIKGVLGLLLSEFPELTPLVRLRYRPGEGAREKSKNKREAHLSGIRMESKLKEEGEDGRGVKAEDSPLVSQKGKNSGRKKESGLRIGFEAGISVESLARLDDDTVWINTQHHAWNKAKREGAENYHVISATAWALSSFLEENRSAQSFVARFLSVWGKEKETPRLF